MLYLGQIQNFELLLAWANDKCIPLVREITFENGEVSLWNNVMLLIIHIPLNGTQTHVSVISSLFLNFPLMLIAGIPLITLKGIFSDSNNIFLWHELDDKTKKVHFQNFSCTFTSCNDYVVFHCYIDFWVKLNIVNDNLCENCCHFTLKWLQLNSFGEMCFW